MRRIFTLLTIISAAFFFSCTLARSFDSKKENKSLKGLSLSASSLSLKEGGMEIVKLKIEGLDPASVEVSWRYDEAIISARTDSSGAVITGKGQGTTILRAEAGGMTANCAVSVRGKERDKAAENPYVYSDTELLLLAPGETKKITSGLQGVPGADPQGFSFTIDNPSVAGLSPAGNYCFATGKEEGLAKLTISHTNAAFSYSLIIATRLDGTAVPYLKADRSIVLLDLGEEKEATVRVSLVNIPASSPEDRSWENGLSYSVQGESVLADGAGTTCLLRAVKGGDSVLRVSHPELSYPLDIFVRVSEAVDPVYIELSPSVLRLKGDKTEILSASLKGLEEGKEGDPALFTWEFPEEAPNYLSIKTQDNEAWLSGKKSGSIKVRVRHPLSETASEALVIISAVEAEAAKASTYISTSQNYVVLEAGGEPSPVSVQIINAKPGEEERLSWSIASFPLDGSGLSVVRCRGSTGSVENKNKPLRSFALEGIGRNIAQGYALFEGLRPGSADVLISHPAALYPIRILIHVEEAGGGSREDAPPPALRAFSARSATPLSSVNRERAYLTTHRNVVVLDKGKSENISVSAVNISPAFYPDLVWRTSGKGIISLSSNGPSATVTPLAEEGEEMITVSHPLSANSLEIYVTIGDIVAYKDSPPVYIATESSVLKGEPGGEEIILRALLSGGENGEEALRQGFGFHISDESLAVLRSSPLGNACFIRPLKSGKAIITLSHDLAVFNKEVLLLVLPGTEGSGGLPFLSTETPFVSLLKGETAALNVRLENAGNDSGGEWYWETDAPSVVDVLSFSGGTAMIKAFGPGSAALSIRSSRASSPLRIITGVKDGLNEKEPEWIKLSSPILNLSVGGSASIEAKIEGAGPEAAKGFIWSLSDASLALLESADGAAQLRGIKAGTAYLHVRHASYPDSSARSVIVNVREKALEGCFIRTDESIIKMKPSNKKGKTIRASLLSATQSAAQGVPEDTGIDAELAARDFIFWLDDPGLLHLSALNDTANIVPEGGEGATYLNISHPKAESPARILIMVENEGEFGFPQASKVISEGDIVFIPMKTGGASAASGEPLRVEYSSSYGSIAQAAGTARVAMIAGLQSGHAEIKARLLKGVTLIAESSLALIVERRSAERTKLSTPSRILSLEKGKSLDIPLSISGAKVKPNDRFGIVWESSDKAEDFIALQRTDGDFTRGDSARITAVIKAGKEKEQGDVVLTARHPAFPDAEPLSIRIVVPGKAEKSLILDQTDMILAKEDGAQLVNATIINGKSEDYGRIAWSASKPQGRTIVSLSKSKGKQCSLIPRQAGTAVLTAALPTGERAFCTVTVVESASIHFNAETLQVNPGYELSLKYSLTPPGAALSWTAQNYSAQGAPPVFDYIVDEALQTVSIKGLSPGKGSLSAFFSSSSGSAMKSVNIIVEYSYKLEFDRVGSPLYSPKEETRINLPFTVFPPDLPVELDYYDDSKLRLLSFDIDKTSGKGTASFAPLWETNATEVRLKATGKDAAGNVKLFTPQKTLSIRYTDQEVEPYIRFKDLKAGSYSGYDVDSKTIILGDGEEMLLEVGFLQKNVQTSDLKLTWAPTNFSTDPDLNTVGSNGHIRVEEEPKLDNASWWRLKHEKDHKVPVDYYYMDYDMSYQIYHNGLFYKNIGTMPGEGVKEWRLCDLYSSDNRPKTNFSWLQPHARLMALSDDDYLTAALSAAAVTEEVEHNHGYYDYGFGSTFRIPYLNSSKGFYNSKNPDDRNYGKKNSYSEVGFYGSRTPEFYEGRPNDRIEFYIATEITTYKDFCGKNSSGVCYRETYGFTKKKIGSRGWLEVVYTKRNKPMLIRAKDFLANPNWSRDEYNLGRFRKDVRMPKMQLHQHAKPVSWYSVDETPRKNMAGILVVTWKNAEGKECNREFNVRVQVRDNEAYSRGRWKTLRNGITWERNP